MVFRGSGQKPTVATSCRCPGAPCADASRESSPTLKGRLSALTSAASADVLTQRCCRRPRFRIFDPGQTRRVHRCNTVVCSSDTTLRRAEYPCEPVLDTVVSCPSTVVSVHRRALVPSCPRTVVSSYRRVCPPSCPRTVVSFHRRVCPRVVSMIPWCRGMVSAHRPVWNGAKAQFLLVFCVYT